MARLNYFSAQSGDAFSLPGAKRSVLTSLVVTLVTPVVRYPRFGVNRSRSEIVVGVITPDPKTRPPTCRRYWPTYRFMVKDNVSVTWSTSTQASQRCHSLTL